MKLPPVPRGRMLVPGASLWFFVEGRPAPKESKSVGRVGQVYEKAPHLKEWLETIAWECLRQGAYYPERRSLRVKLSFHMRKAWRTPDLDKLMRGVFDGLQMGGVIADDKYIVRAEAQRLSVPDLNGRYGCEVRIYDAGEWNTKGVDRQT